MAPPDQTKPETQPVQPTAKPAEQAATPEQAEAATRGQTREGLQAIRDEITQEHTKLEELKKAAQKLTNAKDSSVEWIQKEPQPMNGGVDILFETAANFAINQKINKDNLSAFENIGLNNKHSLETLKIIAKEIITEHYTKTGKNKSNTINYIQGEFTNNLTAVAEKLNQFYEANKDKIKDPKQALEMMGDYCGIEFFKEGKIQPAELKRLILLKKENLDQLVDGFKEYFTLQQTVKTNEEEEKASKLDETTPITDLVENTKLKAKIRITIGENIAAQEEEIKKLIAIQLPETLKPALKEKYTAWAIEKLKEKNPIKGEVRDLAENGTWSDPITPEQIAKENAPPTTPPATPPSETADTENFKTGIEFVDTILEMVKGFSPDLHSTLVSLLQNLWPQSSNEFPNLNSTEKTNAKGLQAKVKGLGLDMDTFKKLFIDSANLKKVLTQKNNDKIEWDEYLKKYLTSAETDALKKNDNADTNSGEKIAAMLLSVNPEYQPPEQTTSPTAVPPENPPPATTPPSA